MALLPKAQTTNKAIKSALQAQRIASLFATGTNPFCVLLNYFLSIAKFSNLSVVIDPEMIYNVYNGDLFCRFLVPLEVLVGRLE